MDDLVYICTKIARQMDAQGLDRIFDAAEAATAAAEEARPLLTRIVELVGEVRLISLSLPSARGCSLGTHSMRWTHAFSTQLSLCGFCAAAAWCSEGWTPPAVIWWQVGVRGWRRVRGIERHLGLVRCMTYACARR